MCGSSFFYENKASEREEKSKKKKILKGKHDVTKNINFNLNDLN